MNKGYLALKNFAWPEMMNLISFGVKHPETLSQTQRITRLYRAVIRRQYTSQLEDFRPIPERFHDKLQQASKDFYRLQDLNNSYATLNQEAKVEFQQLQQKWILWLEENYDAFLYIDESRPYAASAVRHIVYSNEELAHDPLGYYKNRNVTDAKPENNMPLFRDYPYNESHWMMPESFPVDFDDTPTEQKK